MKKFTFDSSWNQIKARLKQRYDKLTERDLHFVEGKAEELLERLQSRIGVSASELHKLLNDLKSEVEDVTDTVHARFETAKHMVADVAHDVKIKVEAVAGDLKASAIETAEQLKEKAGEVYDDARHQVRSWHEQAEGRVREQPRAALLTALVAGFMIGLLIRR